MKLTTALPQSPPVPLKSAADGRELRTEILINAAAAQVWQVLTDFERYSEWNPFVQSISGDLAVGQHLQVHLKTPGMELRISPRVLVVQANRELRWQGQLWLPKIFDGQHIFAIEPISDAQVRFVHREIFGGLLIPLFWDKLKTDTRHGFELMNQALKQRAEQLLQQI